MKFDSYQRFLKSDIYKECVLLELQGKPLLYEESATETGSAAPSDAATAQPEVKSKSKRKSLIPWARIKNSITSNNKAASLSSMPSHKESSFKRPMMMRKITNSITKIRSKSLDDHIVNHINHQAGKHHSSGSGGQDGAQVPASAAVDKVVQGQKSLNLGDSRSSLLTQTTSGRGGSVAHHHQGSDSLDLSDNNNVFSPSPDNSREGAPMSRVASNEESNTSAEQSPINSASGFNHNCNRDNCHFLRVVFPDRSQTVVPSTPNETIETLLRRLLEKRALQYLAYDVFITGGDDKVSFNYFRFKSDLI